MPTQLAIDGEKFLINGRPTYEGVAYQGRRVEGLLLNSRMIQAIFDDENPQTQRCWVYPDTHRWDPDRNTDEFCRALPIYRAHGLLAVTVGLQGGGSIYYPEVYDQYECSAFTPAGELRPAYFDRLQRVLAAADAAGMVVIVNYFYWKHARRFASEAAVIAATEAATAWLLDSGYQNAIVDIANECSDGWRLPILQPGGIHRLIEAAQAGRRDGRRLLVGSSCAAGDALPTEDWLEREDFTMPHGNGCHTARLVAKLRKLRMSQGYARRPRPVLINEDSIFIENMLAALDEYTSWGLYSQGYGSGYKDRMDWTKREREKTCEELSGFQTLPVNWGINTPDKAMFFQAVREIAQGD